MGDTAPKQPHEGHSTGVLFSARPAAVISSQRVLKRDQFVRLTAPLTMRLRIGLFERSRKIDIIGIFQVSMTHPRSGGCPRELARGNLPGWLAPEWVAGPEKTALQNAPLGCLRSPGMDSDSGGFNNWMVMLQRQSRNKRKMVSERRWSESLGVLVDVKESSHPEELIVPIITPERILRRRISRGE